MGYAYKIHDQQGTYFITCTVHQWVDVFTRSCYSDIIVESLQYCRQNKGLEIMCWVIMSNHMHLIVSCKEPNRLSDIIRDFKKYTAAQVVRAIEENTWESRRSWLLWIFKSNDAITFWQPDNHAKEITTKVFFLEKLHYIHENPVRAGLVAKAEHWEYSSAGDFQGMKGKLRLTDYF